MKDNITADFDCFITEILSSCFELDKEREIHSKFS